ncbi:unnamed protein product [Paramecium octaurelia]|uniref:Transmembrane protein n=1 Tax=Paramecium octaurelia TaxID=43137 RepID=A0A8S1W337_PAROT|nr:unnamed protein product [Paramecium octaurelia]
MKILFLVIEVIQVICLIPSFQLKLDQEISLYPTEGELYYYYFQHWVIQDELMCKIEPQIPNVQVMNQCEEIFQTQGNEFISMSSNNTHFITLSYENEVIMYEWKNQIIEQVGESVTIDSSLNCFNINLSLNFSILVDCYQNNEFLLIQLLDNKSIPAYQVQSSMPASTKIQSIVNGTNAFIVYAQYFEDYSILSLFSSSFQNQSTLNNQFIDFDIPITISPNIYAITSQDIFQISISPQSQFQIKINFSQENINTFTTIDVYNDLYMYSQCDQILLGCYYNELPYIIQLLGCENQIFMMQYMYGDAQEPILNVIQNSNFVIFQSNDQIVIQQQYANNNFQYQLYHQQNFLVYINSDNELFIFNEQILAYQINIFSLKVNLTNLESAGNNYTFMILCQNKNQSIYTYNKVYLSVLTKNDTNIYVIFDQSFPQYQISLNINVTNTFNSFSGQLLQYKQNPDGIPLNFASMAQQQAGQINQIYYLEQFLSTIEQDNFIYLIGYNNYSIDILQSQVNPTSTFQFSQICSINISVNASSLQVAYSIQPQMIILGFSANNKIYLFQYYNSNNSIISYSNYTFNSQFSDFVVTYGNVIILFANQQIEIMTFDFTNTFTLNQSSINKLFNNIQFNPIQIVVNTQLLSSLLYINNLNEVIIISIDYNSIPIPISLIKVNYKIKQINIISQQLILSYLCNDDQNTCFQVYNVQNLPIYYFVKSLYSVNVDSEVTIQSDNLFLYVTFNNYTVYAYNPSLPYHQSLYYMLKLSSPIKCAYAIPSYYFYVPEFQYEKSIILLSNNTIYQLNRFQLFQISVEFYNEPFNNSVFYPQFIYNYNVTSILNEKTLYQTPNQSIILYSNFTVFQNQTNQSINLTKHNIIPDSKNFSYPMTLIVDRQVGYCTLKNLAQTNDLNKYCSLTQALQYKSTSIPNYSNFSLITSINNECFALQNSSYIQTVNSNLTQVSNSSYSNLNLTQCLKSTSNNYTLYSICGNNTSQYLLNFTLNCDGNIVLSETIQLPKTFQRISKLNVTSNQIFILGTLENSSFQQLYWFNQFKHNLQIISAATDFSVAQVPKQFEDIQAQLIVIFFTNYYLQQQFMLINDSRVQLGQQAQIEIQFCEDLYFCYLQQDIVYNSVLIIQIQLKSVTILASSNNFSYIAVVKLEQRNCSKNENCKGQGIRTIPIYGDLINKGNSFYSNGVLTQQFINNTNYIIGVYYLNNLLIRNLREPILMFGSFTATVSSYAIIANPYQNGIALYIYDQYILSYPIGTWNITCLLNKKTQNQLNVSIFCNNEFSSGIYNISFNPPLLERNSKRWIYTLISIIVLLLLYFYLKVRQKTIELKYIQQEVEL